MAITLSLSPKANEQGQSEILIRYKSGAFAARTKSGVFVLPEWYNFVIGSETETPYKSKKLFTDAMNETKAYHERRKTELSTIQYFIGETLRSGQLDRSNSDWLNDCIDKFYNRGKYSPKETMQEKRQSFFDVFDDFLEKRKLSDVREKNFKVLKRALQRYELFAASGKNRRFKLELDSTTSETIKDFENFLRNEHALYEEHKDIYDKFPAVINSDRKASKPQPRGMNTINALFNKLRAFFNWCNDTGITNNRPFRNYESTPDLYGTPVYITIDERNTIHNTDLSERPNLAIQRDIFVFQCLIGCRVGDLLKMTRSNIINGAIEYIPRKTKDGHPVTVRVPLNDTAKEILKRYDTEENKLLPFISEQKYNDAIKEIFKIAGITRTVTVINPTTRDEEKRPINEIASSHLARRTFVGNLYKKVKDPNLVGALSGHKDGSRAFARYREIDEEMKSELVKMLE
jgi:integrase